MVERPGSLINAIGIPSKGVPYFIEETLPYYAGYDAPLVVSISAPTAEGFASLAAELSLPGVAAIEANISCPNIEEDGKAFAMGVTSTENVTRQLRAATKLPLWVKLTPNTGRRAGGCPRRRSDRRRRRGRRQHHPVDGDRPEDLQAVPRQYHGRPVRSGHQADRAAPRFPMRAAVKIAVIGCGGISTAEDAVEYMLAGAAAVQIGTATFLQPAAMTTIVDGLRPFACTAIFRGSPI